MFRRKKLNKEDNKKMCLYPKMIKNPKYLPNKKNNNNPPEITDERVKYVPVGCGDFCCGYGMSFLGFDR